MNFEIAGICALMLVINSDIITLSMLLANYFMDNFMKKKNFQKFEQNNIPRKLLLECPRVA